jgi:hypothetical protein
MRKVIKSPLLQEQPCMHVVTHFQWVWQCGGYTDIQGLVATLRILGLRGQFLDLSPVYPEPGSLIRNSETQLRERAEYTLHCNAPPPYKLNKPRVPNEYPANTTQTGSLMHGVEGSSEDCELGRISSQGQSRDFMTPCLAPPYRLPVSKSE